MVRMITKLHLLQSWIFTAAIYSFLPIGCNGAKSTEIKGRLRLPNDQPIDTTLLTLNNGEYNTYTKPDGSFIFYNVRTGVHLLDVQSTTYMFSHVKIQLKETDATTETLEGNGSGLEMKCIQYPYVGASKHAIPHPIILTAHATYNYFQPRPGFSIFNLLKNPMVLMMLFSVFLMVAMPTMMENLDPEQKEQMQRQMEMQQDPSKMLSQLWGDISGGGDVAGANSSGNSSTKMKNGGKNTRRSKKG